jgi:RNA polymerase sigma factor (sigma-70 family)
VAAPDELAAFCRREHPRLVGALTLYCGDRSVAEEIAQDALAAACERWESVSKMAAPGAWVHRVAVNAVSSRFRRRSAERRARSRLEAAHEEAVSDPDGADAIAIRRAVAALPLRQKQALVLRFYLGLSVAEAAAWMDVSEAAVKSLSQRAMATLRGRFGVGPGLGEAKEVDDVTH